MGCIEALRHKVKALTQELVDERVITAQLTEQLENCASCPAAGDDEKSIVLRRNSK
jgi:hypothetical protein